MEYLLISMLSSDVFYSYVFETRKIKHVDPAQKFYRNMVYGMLQADPTIKLTCISIPQVSKNTHNKIQWERKEEYQNEIKFIIPKFTNGTFSRFFSQALNVKKETKNWLKRTDGKERIIICDPLLYHATSAVLKISKKNKCPIISVVTDLPLQWMQMGKNKDCFLRRSFNYLYSYLSEKQIMKYDGYVWLTEQMNTLRNPRKKPFIIIEGFADVHNVKSRDRNNIILPKRFAMYAGGILKVFKLEKMMQAFINANCGETELLIYGDGDDTQTIIDFCNRNSKVKYMGVVDSSTLSIIEKKAILLINPRPTKDEYTIYSFPSKILEYMGSGTATLSTHLPGIPSEYNDYLYYFKGEDIKSMTDTLRDVLNQPDGVLHEFGTAAKRFVYSNKSALVQGKKILEFTNTICRSKII